MAVFRKAITMRRRRNPTMHLILHCILITILSITPTYATSNPKNKLQIQKITTTTTTTTAIPSTQERLSTTNTTLNTTLTPSSSYEYYYSDKEDDLGSDPSTWKMLPIQIPDDLVSNAILQKDVVLSSSTAQSYPTSTGVPQPQPQTLYLQERTQHGLRSDPQSAIQDYNWDRHSAEDNHSKLSPQHQNWDHHGSKNSHSTPEIHHQYWDRHSIESTHSPPQKQHQYWDRHSPESAHSPPQKQHQNWDRHSTDSSHSSLNPQHQNWDRHSPENTHSTPQTKHQHWNHHNLKHNTHLTQHQPNWTHTNYNIQNYPKNDQKIIPQTLPTHPNTPPHHPRLPRPSAWNRNPQNTPSWHQNIVETLTQHLPNLPTLPKIRLPALPNWIFGERVYQEPGYNLQMNSDYVHKFYPLIPENDPLEHLNSNLDRHHSPLYTYPPRQDNTVTQYADKFTDNDDDTDSYVTYHPAGTTLPYLTTKDDSDLTTHHAHPDPRRPLHAHAHVHARPQRILKIPQHQHHQDHSQHQHSTPTKHSWAWERQQDAHTTPIQPLRNPYDRQKNPTHNWISQETGNGGDSYIHSSSSHSQHHSQHTHSTPNQQHQQHQQHHHHHHHQQQQQEQQQQQQQQQGVNSPWYSESQHHHHHQQQQQQQQQGVSSPWHSESQHQQGLNEGFHSEIHDNILEPLSNLLNRPSPLSMLTTLPYQQSIIERLTGVDTSSTNSFVIPGGLLVLGLAFALFYFNFVWYPTPVVTAKIYKMLSDSASEGALSEGQQRAVGEVRLMYCL